MNQQHQHPGASSYAVPYTGFVGPNDPYSADASPPMRFDGRPDWIPYDAAYPTQNGYAHEPPPPPMYFSPDPSVAARLPMMAPHPWTQQHYGGFRVPPHTAPVGPIDERGAAFQNPSWSLPARHSPRPALLDQAGLRRIDEQPTYTMSPTFGPPPHSAYAQRIPANAHGPLSVGPPGASQALQTSRALQQTLDHGPISLPPPGQPGNASETDLRARFSASSLGHAPSSEPTEPGSVPVARLPSNSHHLLNSPEGRRAAVRHQLQYGAGGREVEGSDDEDAEGEADDSAEHQRRVFPSEHLSNFGATAATTPGGSPRGRNDAAQVLLSLARSDSSQGAANDHPYSIHGMALRSGRGTGPSADDRRFTRSSVSPSRGKPSTIGAADAGQPPPPPALQSPMEAKRYHTRSQPEEEPHPHYDPYQPGQSTGLGLPPGMISHESRSCTASPVESRSRVHLVHPSVMGSAPTTPQTSGSYQTRLLPSLPSLGFGPPMSVSAGSTGTGAATGHQPTTGSRRKGKHRASDSLTATTGTTTTATTATATTTANGFDDDSRSSYSVSTPGTSASGPPSSVSFSSRRTFPQIPIDPTLSRLYRNFPVSSAFGDREPVRSLAAQHGIPLLPMPSGAVFNPPAHGHLDLYTPRFTRGVGADKVGACCICAESTERGGEDAIVWLKMKVSSYSYHLSFYHGVNNVSGLPFSPPVDIRQVKRAKVATNEKSLMREGQCHQCLKWVPLEGVKNSEVKVPELFWWKHAKACHKSRLPGEANVHSQDDVYDLVARAAHQTHVSNPNLGGSAGGVMTYHASPNGSVVSHSPGIVQQPIMMPPQHQHQYVYPSPHPSSSNPASAYGFHPHPGGSTLPSPALTAASHGSNGSYFVHHHPHHHPGGGSSGGTTPKIHPSVGAQRAAAQRAWKRKSDVVDMGLAGGSGSLASGNVAGSPAGSGSGKRSRRSGPDLVQ